MHVGNIIFHVRVIDHYLIIAYIELSLLAVINAGVNDVDDISVRLSATLSCRQKHLHDPIDTYHKKLFSLLPKRPIINQQRRKRKKLTHLEQLDEHSFSVR